MKSVFLSISSNHIQAKFSSGRKSEDTTLAPRFSRISLSRKTWEDRKVVIKCEDLGSSGWRKERSNKTCTAKIKQVVPEWSVIRETCSPLVSPGILVTWLQSCQCTEGDKIRAARVKHTSRLSLFPTTPLSTYFSYLHSILFAFWCNLSRVSFCVLHFTFKYFAKFWLTRIHNPGSYKKRLYLLTSNFL